MKTPPSWNDAIENGSATVSVAARETGLIDWTEGWAPLAFPSPRPSPQGRERLIHRLSITPAPEFARQPAAKHPSDACCSLSLRERVRVRGKYSAERAKGKISGGRLGNAAPCKPYNASRLTPHALRLCL